MPENGRCRPDHAYTDTGSDAGKSTLRRIITLIITLPIVALAVLFAIDNRQDVMFRLTPLSPEIEIPLFLLVLGAFFVGFLLGALFVWVHDLHIRCERRAEAKRADKLESELEDLRESQKDAGRTQKKSDSRAIAA